MGDHDNLQMVTYRSGKVKKNGYCDQTDLIVREKAITIYVNSEELATVVCSPRIWCIW